MAACSLFEEDEVYVEKLGKGVSFGLVLENAEFLSSSEDDEVDKTEDRLQKGMVRVAWHPTGKETVVAEDNVHLIDRSLMPGDVVRCLVPGQDTQCGFVMDMDVKCHLHVLRTNKYIYDVDSKDLVPLQKFESGQEVLLDSWLGRVETVNYELIIVFPDGARCQVDEDDLFSCEDITEKRPRHGEFSVCLHYPGQELKGSMDCFSDAKWLHSSPRYCSKVANKKGKVTIVYVTVEKIITKNVEVHWIFRGYEKVDSPNVSVNPPPRMIEGETIERLQVLDWFSHCSIQIGDRMAYTVKNDDLISTVIPGKAFNPQSVMTKDAPIKILNEVDNRISEDVISSVSSFLIKCQIFSFAERDLEDAEDADFEDVEDDESEGDDKLGAYGGRSAGGRRKKNRGHKGTTRHKPGKPNPNHKITVGKKRSPKERIVKPDEVVEVEIEFTTSWAKVMWQDGTVEKDIPSVSLFPVHHLDELEFFPGDFVLPNIELTEPVDYGVVVKADHHERTCWIHWFRAYDVGKATEPTCVERNAEMSVYDIKDHPDYKFRPGQSIVRVGGFETSTTDQNQTPQTIGQICELEPNGHLFIKWTDGTISQHFPQEIFIVSDDADDFTDDSWESESDYASEGSVETWETESEQEIIGEEDEAKTDKDDSGYDQVVLCEHKQELDSLLYRAETALVRLQKHLSNFDVTVSAPECFHDIIRIYRSCHDLDKILQSSFFNDPELQALISQAKYELKRDKPNKISKHLTQLFESWSKSLPAGPMENVGSVAIGGKTIRVGLLQKGEDIEVSIEVPKDEDDVNEPSAQHSGDLENKGAMGGGAHVEGGDSCPVIASHSLNLSTASNSLSEISEIGSIKKEFSEPAISKFCRNNETRRPSDPFNETNMSTGAKGKKKNQDALVGENCVSKAAKRAKSDGYDDSGREVKKSRDEAKTANHVAQELCSKICQNLQKQILKIHEEVNKRTKRLMSSGSGSLNKNETDQAKNGGDDKLAATACSKGTHENLEHQVDENNIAAKPDNMQKSLTNGGEINIFETEEFCSSNLSEMVSASTPLTSEVYNCGDVLKMGAENHLTDLQKARDTSEKAVNPETENKKALPSPDSSISQEIEGSITLEDVKAEQVPCKGFEMHGEVESFHRYVSQESQPANPRSFRTAIRKELKLFQSSLPDGIFVKGFENRLDLYSVMILGPEGTPYEDAVFLFDLMLPNDYPNSPPLCHYHSYCTDRLNPNLYEDGKVCVSLLGTWSGKGTEVWTSKSNLLQVLLSIQGLILVSEPYYNEAGYERQRGTQVGHENSRMYNEMAILKSVQSLIKMCNKLPTLFKHEIYQYLKAHGHLMIRRLRNWMDQSQRQKKPTGIENQECQNTNKVSMNKCETGPNLHSNATIETSSRDASHQYLSPSIASQDNQDLVDGTIEEKSQMTINCKDDLHNDFTESSLCTKLRVNESLYNNIDSLDSNLPSNRIATHLPRVLSLSAVSDSETKGMANDCQKMNEGSVSLTDQDGKMGSDMCTHEFKEMPAVERGCLQPEFHDAKYSTPQFPLFPMSRGFCLTLEKFLNTYEKSLQQLLPPPAS
ncbi:unnamed protein product [Lymnaea stagnalis]|uniref:UBC core domain-containing protein n=1 Tax=Lymnaea stagnalis TaxID=6523 RepID=A0AAV2GYC0_LYMST